MSRRGGPSEFELIRRLAARSPLGRKDLLLGVGDDCALLDAGPGNLVVTVDALAEGVHFDLSYTPLKLLGRKALACGLSDVAAMGARAAFYLVTLLLPEGFGPRKTERIYDGLAEAARAGGVALAGGDVSRSRSGLVLDVVVIGRAPARGVVKRSGAREGDRLLVTGTPGDSALGLLALRRGRDLPRGGRGAAPLKKAHLDPAPPFEAGAALGEAGLAAAMIDISDGLLGDLGHIVEESSKASGRPLGARVELERIPLSAAYRKCEPDLSPEPWAAALTGGEDYQLLFACRPEKVSKAMKACRKAGASATEIGVITDSGKVEAVDGAGRALKLRSRSFTHF